MGETCSEMLLTLRNQTSKECSLQVLRLLQVFSVGGSYIKPWWNNIHADSQLHYFVF